MATLIMTGLGCFFGLLLATASHFLRVEEDPRLERVDELLPGTNCGACGVPGCRAFAEKLVAGEAKPAGCTVGSAEGLASIAEFLGVDVGAKDKRVALLKCAGGEGLAVELAAYSGMDSCRGAVLVNGGGRACAWGCLGLGDCERVCDFDAIFMNSEGLPTVIADACTACNDCVVVCPLDLFVIEPLSNQLFVQCNTPMTGEEAMRRCKVACDACGKCAADEPDLIEMVNGLPVVHYDREQRPSEKAIWRCPTRAIVWLEGQQFPDSLPPVESGEPRNWTTEGHGV